MREKEEKIFLPVLGGEQRSPGLIADTEENIGNKTKRLRAEKAARAD